MAMKYPPNVTVPENEVDQRLREFREKGLEHRAMPHIVYRPPFVACPWSDCDYSISGIDFQLELMADQALYEQLMKAWWTGAGLVGLCPACRRYVLFTMKNKRCVDDPSEYGGAVLPHDWHKHAFILS